MSDTEIWGSLWDKGDMLRDQASKRVRETVHTCVCF